MFWLIFLKKLSIISNFIEKYFLLFNSFKKISGHSIRVIEFSKFSKIFKSELKFLISLGLQKKRLPNF